MPFTGSGNERVGLDAPVGLVRKRMAPVPVEILLRMTLTDEPRAPDGFDIRMRQGEGDQVT